MREIETCQVCEQEKANWKYTFGREDISVSLQVCDKCAGFLLSASNDKLNKYRNLERITPQKTLNLTRK